MAVVGIVDGSRRLLKLCVRILHGNRSLLTLLLLLQRNSLSHPLATDEGLDGDGCHPKKLLLVI